MTAILEQLFASRMGCGAEEIRAFPASGSNRRYFRLSGGGRSAVGVLGCIPEENRAFVELARHFRAKGLHVPEVLAVSADGMAYLQEDLGDRTLFDCVSKGRESGLYSPEERALLKKTVRELPRLQFLGAEGLDWKLCYPQEAFDARMVDFDLNYFKYCYLKATGLEFNEQLLQDDFDRFRRDLLQEEPDTFLYRDFQARNVMIRDGEPWFIDFQGGRRGPIYYDLASFIGQARARYPEALRQELAEAYLEALQPFRKVEKEAFMDRLRLFMLFRTMQVLGAYGFRGLYERKQQFIDSIPGALENLRRLLPFPEYPYLNKLLRQLCQPKADENAPRDGVLEVQVSSFSFKKGIPADTSANGGGYVFDCRSLHNPGRYDAYKKLNGTDAPVIAFLEEHSAVKAFLDSAYKLVDAHIACFLERGFTHLQVSFGCTGGQHRSAYCAQHMAAHIKELFPAVRVRLVHRELGREEVL